MDQPFQDFLKFEDLFVILSMLLWCFLLLHKHVFCCFFWCSYRNIFNLNRFSLQDFTAGFCKVWRISISCFLRNQRSDCFQLKTSVFQLVYFKKKLDIKRCIIAVSQFIAPNPKIQFFLPVPQNIRFHACHCYSLSHRISFFHRERPLV